MSVYASLQFLLLFGLVSVPLVLYQEISLSPHILLSSQSTLCHTLILTISICSLNGDNFSYIRRHLPNIPLLIFTLSPSVGSFSSIPGKKFHYPKGMSDENPRHQTASSPVGRCIIHSTHSTKTALSALDNCSSSIITIGQFLSFFRSFATAN